MSTPIGSRGQNNAGEHRDHCGPARQHPCARFQRDVIGPDHERFQPALFVERPRSNLIDLHHRERRLDHHPDTRFSVGAKLVELAADDS